MKIKRTEREEEDFDVDQDVLDRILNKLYDFGDGPDDKRSKKKRKKRKRIKQDEEEEEDVTAQEEALDRTDYENGGTKVSDMTTNSDSETLESNAPRVEIVTFQDPLKKNKLKRAVEAETKVAEVKEKKTKDLDVLSMEKARLDVHQFGIRGFQKHQQRVFEQDRAIMLGARPPKKDYINYKLYQQMIKEKKSKEKEQEASTDVQNKKKKKKTSGKQKNVKRKSGSSSADPTGHVGRFKDGMLVLSSKDIQKLNRRVRK
ncbi:uncharacterized protein C1orf131 homolog [Neoarius graeffei]|uniref:uncharacterized protein C1orf131 homolog n=1 Tax=Neoarius graeffei TaxID=443677 RepID=UPI00298CE969|nr:uncharacterized protein C1orf131 homolog [Neoarius graeffei]